MFGGRSTPSGGYAIVGAASVALSHSGAPPGNGVHPSQGKLASTDVPSPPGVPSPPPPSLPDPSPPTPESPFPSSVSLLLPQPETHDPAPNAAPTHTATHTSERPSDEDEARMGKLLLHGQ